MGGMLGTGGRIGNLDPCHGVTGDGYLSMGLEVGGGSCPSDRMGW